MGWVRGSLFLAVARSRWRWGKILRRVFGDLGFFGWDDGEVVCDAVFQGGGKGSEGGNHELAAVLVAGEFPGGFDLIPFVQGKTQFGSAVLTHSDSLNV